MCAFKQFSAKLEFFYTPRPDYIGTPLSLFRLRRTSAQTQHYRGECLVRDNKKRPELRAGRSIDCNKIRKKEDCSNHLFLNE